MDDVLQDFLDRKIYVKWNTQDEIEHLADIIDQVTGKHYSRDYMRGYKPSQYEYWGMEPYGGSLIYCLYSRTNGRICSYEELLTLLNFQEEQAIDITSLL